MREAQGRGGTRGRRPAGGPGRGVTAVLAAALLLAGCGTGSSAPSHSRAATAAPHRPSPSPTPVWNPHPQSVAALGDSITRGFDACSLLSDCPEVSWATGSRAGVDSLAGRLRGSAQEGDWNFARTGARMADLPGQMRQAALQRPQLVTVLMGANDACAHSVDGMTSIDDFRNRFTAAMDELRRTSPKTEVYVSSIPDLLRLWSVGRHNPLGEQIWKLGVCPSMLADSANTAADATARREAVRARVMAYNSALGEACGRYPLCRYDGGAVFQYAFGTDELSDWDWFHPSTKGQAELARLGYDGVTRS
ncbi:SGNH/GDSL hydrolase family protein [Streptantibioticus ferralitis]|uniref:GDSL-type esterase/lipase family protein n=1 Tax=Streptantibioticus ferralitis TaxID=236510 RepID=A0ABT5Z2E1_9ACTN|nr:SGNH/GDSL hydrolase family protein [Streptantibioticus ferralitis]MDF2257997.1 GDSL-type esterase/lipase family protein [Streptantibioticus ferralitis]